MINPAIDLNQCKEELKSHSRIQIENFLSDNMAEELRVCLLNDTPWDLTYYGGERGEKISHQDLQKMDQQSLLALIDKIVNCSPNEYQFLYESYMIVTAYLEGRNQGHLLHKFLEVINSSNFLQSFRTITGDNSILKVDAQATRYSKGHFLKEHIDADSDQGRRYAYVLNLTKNWIPDWGGLLHFNSNNKVVDTMVPRFNTLNIFEVPQEHFVSSVTGYAGEERISITGWMYNK